jgi:DNA-binding HxlR family transcriptional regulator
MTMGTQDQQALSRIRINVLRQLHGAHPATLTADHLHNGLRYDREPCTQGQLESQLLALEEAGQVKCKPSPVNGAVKEWQLTEAGRLVLVELNFA